jgi:hypothetical protein
MKIFIIAVLAVVFAVFTFARPHDALHDRAPMPSCKHCKVAKAAKAPNP